MSKVAMCPNCEDEVLVMTFAFNGKEFFCLGCGGDFEFLEPRAADETPELLERLAQRKEEWKPIGTALLTGGARKTDCAICASKDEPHLAHATDEEREAHEAAVEYIVCLRGG